MPTLILLANMELNGIGFSNSECESQKELLLSSLSALEAEAYRLAGHPFSLSAPDDIAQVLFVELRLPPAGDPTNPMPVKTLGPARRTTTRGRPKQQYSTAKEVLEKLQALHALPGVILEWRKINSALSKVVFPLQKEKLYNDRLAMERIYGESETYSSTGRVSMREPNLQNIPKDFIIHLPVMGKERDTSRKRGSILPGSSMKVKKGATEVHVRLRNVFIPFEGGVMLAADYSQLELRIIAHLSRDRKLISVLNEGGDVFRAIAAQWRGLEPCDVTTEQRQQAKQICYGMIYGIGAKALSEQLGVDENEAACFMESFKSKYTGMRRFLNETVKFCKENGYVQTVMGRRRYLPAITSTNMHARGHAERQAVNTCVQGSAADLVKKAMVDIDCRLTQVFPQCRYPHRFRETLKASKRQPTASRNLLTSDVPPRGAYLLLQLHDELIYEVHSMDLPACARIVRDCMQGAIQLDVNLEVKIKVGPRWASLEEYDEN